MTTPTPEEERLARLARIAGTAEALSEPAADDGISVAEVHKTGDKLDIYTTEDES